jgi:hypothetical protein
VPHPTSRHVAAETSSGSDVAADSLEAPSYGHEAALGLEPSYPVS